MTRNLAIAGVLAFALAGVASPGVAWGSVHPASVPARPGHAGTVPIWNPGDPPVITHAKARPGQPGQVPIWNPGDPPIIRRSQAAPGSAIQKLSAQADTPTVRDSAARMGDPDDGGQ
jgi:hypothetical protein